MSIRFGSESFTIMEWNINHRVGSSGEAMPEWVIDVINEKSADIIILTECSQRVPNWLEIKKKLFSGKQYVVFESNNDQAGQNDVLIAVNKNKFKVIYSKTYYSGNINTPDYLEVKCKCIFNGPEFTIVGMRIHDRDVKRPKKMNAKEYKEYEKKLDERDSKRNQEFRCALDNLSNEEVVIIAGDFNNYKRGCTRTFRQNWCMEVLDEICTEKGFRRYTPYGSSMFQEHKDNDGDAFAQDHFIIKGIDEERISLLPYDRSFAGKDKTVYMYGNDFSIYNYEWREIEWAVPTPYPDHAILIAEITL